MLLCKSVRGPRTSRCYLETAQSFCASRQSNVSASCFIKNMGGDPEPRGDQRAQPQQISLLAYNHKKKQSQLSVAPRVSAGCDGYTLPFSTPLVTQVTSKQTQPMGRATEPASGFHTKLTYHGKTADCLLKQFPFLGARPLAQGLKETKSYDSSSENLVSA